MVYALLSFSRATWGDLGSRVACLCRARLVLDAAAYPDLFLRDGRGADRVGRRPERHAALSERLCGRRCHLNGTDLWALPRATRLCRHWFRCAAGPDRGTAGQLLASALWHRYRAV